VVVVFVRCVDWRGFFAITATCFKTSEVLRIRFTTSCTACELGDEGTYVPGSRAETAKGVDQLADGHQVRAVNNIWMQAK
jgi:hypothetical protein